MRTEHSGPHGSTVWQKRYFDGLGRVWKVEKKGKRSANDEAALAEAPEDIVSEWSRDKRGNVYEIKGPYYAKKTPGPVVSRRYDARDRVIEISWSPAIKKKVHYRLGGVTLKSLRVAHTDEMGHEQVTYFDMRGRERSHYNKPNGTDWHFQR